MKTHYLKTVQPFFSNVKNGTKTFEHRRNDRDFQVGDEVYLQEYDLQKNTFSGQEVRGIIQPAELCDKTTFPYRLTVFC